MAKRSPNALVDIWVFLLLELRYTVSRAFWHDRFDASAGASTASSASKGCLSLERTISIQIVSV